MVGGFSTPKKDKMLKVSQGKLVKTGEILARNMPVYKAGVNVRGLSTVFAACAGKVYFSKKKTSHGRVRTFINVEPLKKAGK
ncbi:MAG: 50S ribosomal protein L27 [Candidatus Omnitrophota bacterium]|nr:50S ribosomal protein L27 [Candidatus Omnitrophota bacterium]